MNERLNSFYRELKDKKVSFIGLGRSHRELLGMFAAKGAQVSLRDKRTREQIGEKADRLEAMGIRLLLGENYLEGLCSEDLLLRTPGMYYFHPALQQARQAGVAVTSEMELFFDLCPCKIYAVTGSDGKTTTTSVIAELLKKQGYRVFLGGNIGFPLLPRIEQIYDAIHTAEETGAASVGWARGVYPTRATAQAALDDGALFVLTDGGALVAAGRIDRTQVPVYAQVPWQYAAPPEQVLVLHTLVVDPTIAGHGYGTQFVRFYARRARALGCTVLRIDTNAKNAAARRLYARLGFREAAIVPCTFNSIAGVELVCLEKRLDAE